MLLMVKRLHYSGLYPQAVYKVKQLSLKNNHKEQDNQVPAMPQVKSNHTESEIITGKTIYWSTYAVKFERKTEIKPRLRLINTVARKRKKSPKYLILSR